MMKEKKLVIFAGILVMLLLSISSSAFARTAEEISAELDAKQAEVAKWKKLAQQTEEFLSLKVPNPNYDYTKHTTEENAAYFKRLEENYNSYLAVAQKAQEEADALLNELSNVVTNAPLGPEEHAAALEEQAAILEAQAASIQAVNPAGAQALQAQAAALRQQAAGYRQGAAKLATSAEQEYDKNYKLIVPIPGYEPGANADPLGYIKGIYNFGIGFGMLIAVAIIVFAGLKWTTSAGNVSAQSEAKDMILNAVFGVVMLLGAVLILRTIDPKLTKLTLPNLKLPKSDFDFGEYNNYVKKMEELNKQSYDNNRKVEETLAKVTAAQNEYNKNPTKENLIKLKKEAIAWNTALVSKYQTDLATFETMKDEAKRQLDAIKAAGALDEAGIKDWIARVGVPLYGIIATKNDISDYNNAVAKAESAYARAYQRVVETKAQLSGAQTTLAALQQELAELEKP